MISCPESKVSVLDDERTYELLCRGIGIDDIMCDDITCDDLHLASMARMDDIICDDLNPDVCEIVVLGLMI